MTDLTNTYRKLEADKNMTIFLTLARPTPWVHTNADIAEKINSEILLAEQGIDQVVSVAVTGEFKRLDNNQEIKLEYYTHCDTSQGQTEIFVVGEGYVPVILRSRSNYRLYI